jgi:uncharacterized membrane protein YdbT with pleckstrin-like domain
MPEKPNLDFSVKPKETIEKSTGDFDPEPGVDFRGRRSNEKVILVARYHWWLLMPIAFCWLAAIALIIAAIWFFGATAVVSIAIAAVGLAALIYSFYEWFLWVNGNYIITNQRVIRTEQMSLFRRQIAEAEIDRIQEISTYISGPVHTLLGFGTVRIRTASGSDQVDLEDVADPYAIQQEIARVQRQLGKQEQAPPSVNRSNRMS